MHFTGYGSGPEAPRSQLDNVARARLSIFDPEIRATGLLEKFDIVKASDTVDPQELIIWDRQSQRYLGYGSFVGLSWQRAGWSGSGLLTICLRRFSYLIVPAGFSLANKQSLWRQLQWNTLISHQIFMTINIAVNSGKSEFTQYLRGQVHYPLRC